jgi:hypothetical protein
MTIARKIRLFAVAIWQVFRPLKKFPRQKTGAVVLIP